MSYPQKRTCPQVRMPISFPKCQSIKTLIMNLRVPRLKDSMKMNLLCVGLWGLSVLLNQLLVQLKF